MTYDPRSKSSILTKFALRSTESVPDFLASKTRSAKESIEDQVVEDRAKKSLQSYVLSQAISTISDARLFFSQDAETAYQELIDLLSSAEIKEKVIKYLEEENAKEEELRQYYKSDEEWQEHLASKRCYEANKAVLSARAELDAAQQWKEVEEKRAKEKCPNIKFDVE